MCLLLFRENAVRDETVPECTVQNNSSVRNGNLKTSVSLFVYFVYGIYFLTFNCFKTEYFKKQLQRRVSRT